MTLTITAATAAAATHRQRSNPNIVRIAFFLLIVCFSLYNVIFSSFSVSEVLTMMSCDPTYSQQQQQLESGTTVEQGYSNTTSQPCLTRAFLHLCLSIPSAINDTNNDMKVMECQKNPPLFFQRQFEKYAPSEKEVNARKMMQNFQLTTLSVGSNKMGRCNDVRDNDQTMCTERAQLDLFRIDSWWSLMVDNNPRGLDVVFAEHVLEHFHPQQVIQILAAAFLVLKPGGVIRIAVPDGYKPSQEYQQYIRAGGTSSGTGQFHMISWTVDNMSPLFSAVGFRRVEPQEYFDAEGTFHTSPSVYDKDDQYGKIHRSYRHDDRNAQKPYQDFIAPWGNLSAKALRDDEPFYTSLWIDAFKPDDCQYVPIEQQLQAS